MTMMKKEELHRTQWFNSISVFDILFSKKCPSTVKRRGIFAKGQAIEPEAVC